MPFAQLDPRRSWLARAIVTTAICMACTGSLASAADLEVPPGYKLVWADEFDRDGLPDPAKWEHDTSRNQQGWHNHELQYYSAPRAANAVVKGGRLIITARKEWMSSAADFGGQTYTSARLQTRDKVEWTYGFFEVRARLPCGKGTWPAIWMLGSKGSWPANGELDIMEQVGSDPTRVFSTVHTTAGHGGQSVSGIVRIADACQNFHRYQMLWTASEVTFAVDGFAHLRYPRLDAGRDVWPFDRPQFLLLNLAIGGDLGGEVDDRIFPVAMEVDYVRVYQAAKP